jgi:hypothetical protein
MHPGGRIGGMGKVERGEARLSLAGVALAQGLRGEVLARSEVKHLLKQ